MEAHQIIKAMHCAFPKVVRNLARMTGKSEEWYHSHGREPKTRNPMQSGNVSDVEKYMQYVRMHEAAEPASGMFVNNRVHAELDMEFAENSVTECQNDLSSGVLKECSDLLQQMLHHDFTECDLSTLKAIEEEAAQLRDKASEVISRLRAVYRLKSVG